MKNGELTVATTVRREFVDITARLAEAVRASGVQDGVLCLYNPHTTAGLPSMRAPIPMSSMIFWRCCRS